MKFIIIGPAKYHYTESIADTIKELGNSVTIIPYVEFYESCTYLERKLYKFGVSCLKSRWDDEWEKDLIDVCTECKKTSDSFYILIVGNIELSEKVFKALSGIKKIICMWDSIKNNNRTFYDKLHYFDNVYVFEKSDINILADMGIQSSYLPLGYNGKIFFPKEEVRNIDISFIGMPDSERFHTLEFISKYAVDNGLSVYICGDWYDKKHFWRKYKYAKKHPELYKFINNRMVSAVEAADIYNRSKICLNINRKVHTSINPRTFEILSTQSCMFMNTGVDVQGVLVPGIDYVEYDNDSDLINKIDYMLKNVIERKKIAKSGYLKIAKTYSMQTIYEKLLFNIKNVRN